MFAEPVESLFKTSEDSQRLYALAWHIYAEYRLEPEGIKVLHVSHLPLSRYRLLRLLNTSLLAVLRDERRPRYQRPLWR